MTKENFTGDEFRNKVEGFENPIQSPKSEEQRLRWQIANKMWWEATPMRYDWRSEITHPKFSPEYFAEIDRRFFGSSRHYLPYKNLPFEALIPFEELSNLDVLEIGVGHGSHAGLIAPLARSFSGIDLTSAAVESTSHRLSLLNLPTSRVLQMDAEQMSFPSSSFDYIWSWGVIHHSADTRRVLQEMHRVLRKGGRASVMIYHRSFWKYYVMDGLLKGVLLGQLSDGYSLVGVNQRATDGAIARYYRPSEWEKLVCDLFRVDTVQVTGLKSDVIPLPAGALKDRVEKVLPDVITRFFTNTLRWGSFLSVHMTKI